MTKPKAKPRAPEKFYTVAQAARVLKIHPESLRRAVREKTIPLQAYEQPSYRSKRKYFFKIIDVELLAAAREAAQKSK